MGGRFERNTPRWPAERSGTSPRAELELELNRAKQLIGEQTMVIGILKKSR
jgi:hypothetical protein